MLDVQSELRVLQFYKQENENALRQALERKKKTKDRSRCSWTAETVRERQQWLQKVVEEEQHKPLEVTADFAKNFQAREKKENERWMQEQERRIANIRKLQEKEQGLETGRRKWREYRRVCHALEGQFDRHLDPDEPSHEPSLSARTEPLEANGHPSRHHMSKVFQNLSRLAELEDRIAKLEREYLETGALPFSIPSADQPRSVRAPAPVSTKVAPASDPASDPAAGVAQQPQTPLDDYGGWGTSSEAEQSPIYAEQPQQPEGEGGQGPYQAQPVPRQRLVFVKKKTDGNLYSPSRTYYTIRIKNSRQPDGPSVPQPIGGVGGGGAEPGSLHPGQYDQYDEYQREAGHEEDGPSARAATDPGHYGQYSQYPPYSGEDEDLAPEPYVVPSANPAVSGVKLRPLRPSKPPPEAGDPGATANTAEPDAEGGGWSEDDEDAYFAQQAEDERDRPGQGEENGRRPAHRRQKSLRTDHARSASSAARLEGSQATGGSKKQLDNLDNSGDSRSDRLTKLKEKEEKRQQDEERQEKVDELIADWLHAREAKEQARILNKQMKLAREKEWVRGLEAKNRAAEAIAIGAAKAEARPKEREKEREMEDTFDGQGSDYDPKHSPLPSSRAVTKDVPRPLDSNSARGAAAKSHREKSIPRAARGSKQLPEVIAGSRRDSVQSDVRLRPPHRPSTLVGFDSSRELEHDIQDEFGLKLQLLRAQQRNMEKWRPLLSDKKSRIYLGR